MARLNQILAVEKGVKARAFAELTELHNAIQKPDLFNGFVKSYAKRDEDDTDLPGERKRVQMTVAEMLQRATRSQTELYDTTARRDWTNCSALASVVVDGKLVLANVPATYLLFLEKQLTDLHTFVSKLPTLDEGEAWTKDANSGFYVTDTVSTHRTKKVQKALVLYPATPEHPAQTQLVTEDVIAGFWNQFKQSGAIPKPERAALATKVEKLLAAVKQAREAANMTEEATPPKVADALFTYLGL